jgi:putative toxin-antitoxin system antitoxin component (TIGR02293 family)
MIPADKIAEVLGLQQSIHSLPDLARCVAEGLPKSSLRRCVERVVKDRETQRGLIHRIVPEATYKRRGDLLKLEESEHTERLARVIATAEYVWDDVEESQRFLITPNPALGGQRPIDAAYTELGARQVEELLWQIFHGLPL